MAAPDLPTPMKLHGDALLTSLRASKVDVLAALWNFLPTSGEWRLVIVSPQVESRGPKELLRFTYKALQVIDGGASFTFFDVDFRSPHSSSVMLLVEYLSPFKIEGSGSFHDIQLNDMFIEHMFVYTFDASRILAANEVRPKLAAE